MLSLTISISVNNYKSEIKTYKLALSVIMESSMTINSITLGRQSLLEINL